MEHLEIAFVILHYNNVDDTIDTVSSIVERIDTSNYLIVIVDNASPNNTGRLLLDRYKGSKNIHVIINNENLGFSAGNNVGINFVRQNYNADFIILSNNDIFLYENEFAKKIIQCFKRTNFAVMGPMVLTGDGRCDSNPISDQPYSRELCKKEISLFDFYLKLNRYKLLKSYFYLQYYINKFFPFFNKRKNGCIKSYDKGIFMQERKNVVLHGCFLILSKMYFEYFEGLDSRTFMYSEENILYRHLESKGLTMLYYPEIAIYHKVGSSVRKSYLNSIQAMVFKYRIKTESHKAYLRLLDELKVD